MSADYNVYLQMFGEIDAKSINAAPCACVKCNSCTCACSCHAVPEFENGEIEW